MTAAFEHTIPALTNVPTYEWSPTRQVPRPRLVVVPVTSSPARCVSSAAGLVKGAVDILAALLLVVLTAPLLLLLAVAVRSDGGPVFFRQTRVGLDGREFTMVKFRSMVVDAEARLTALHAADEGSGLLFKMRNDPRITRVGAVLRKYSLDELPQLLNVVSGSMSLVGPRPSLPREVAAYDTIVARRLAVKPGMTGLWQVSGRSDLSWDESIRLDLHYVENWTPALDVKILAGTARAVLRGGGAY